MGWRAGATAPDGAKALDWRAGQEDVRIMLDARHEVFRAAHDYDAER
jgi:hypothetical protein